MKTFLPPHLFAKEAKEPCTSSTVVFFFLFIWIGAVSRMPTKRGKQWYKMEEEPFMYKRTEQEAIDF